jgi:putative dimethyl sulfoxide reductase chaperone
VNENYADAFAAVWTALASVLRTEAPTAEVVDAMRDPELLAQWPLADPELGEVGELATAGIADLRESEEDHQTIADDQFKLIRGPGEPIAVPWESVYRSLEGLLFEAQTMQVRDFYKRFNLQAPRMNVEPDDHISLELDFCVQLLTRGLAAGAQGQADVARAHLDAHDDFCREHLLRWAPTFFQRLTAGATTHFYRGIGQLGQDAMRRLGALVEPAKR